MFGDTPLILAVRHHKPNAMKMLLATPGIQVDAQDCRGRSALTWAVLKRDMECIITLLDDRADVNQAAECKKTPIMFAATLDQDEPISGNGETDVMSMVEILRLLLDHAVRYRKRKRTLPPEILEECMVRRDELGWCALHLAAKSNLLAQCSTLSARIPINIMTDSGCHALHIAAWNGREATVLYLFQGPANRQWHPALRSNLMLPSGHTPLDLAIIKSHFVCVNLMLSAPHNLTCFANVCVEPPPRQQQLDDVDPGDVKAPRISLQQLLHTLILRGDLQSAHGLLQFDENMLNIDSVLLSITRQIKYRCTCTFSFTNYTHPIRQYMYRCHDCTEKKHREKKNAAGKEEMEPVIVCLVCKDECHKGHRLTLEVDPYQDGDIAHYCQCTKATCMALSRMGE